MSKRMPLRVWHLVAFVVAVSVSVIIVAMGPEYFERRREAAALKELERLGWAVNREIGYAMTAPPGARLSDVEVSLAREIRVLGLCLNAGAEPAVLQRIAELPNLDTLWISGSSLGRSTEGVKYLEGQVNIIISHQQILQ